MPNEPEVQALLARITELEATVTRLEAALADNHDLAAARSLLTSQAEEVCGLQRQVGELQVQLLQAATYIRNLAEWLRRANMTLTAEDAEEMATAFEAASQPPPAATPGQRPGAETEARQPRASESTA